MSNNKNQRRLAVIGLGYVGLPLAIELAKYFPLVGFDNNAERVKELQEGRDHTGEVDLNVLKATHAKFTSDAADLSQADFYIIAVPTPVGEYHRPDLSPLKSASTLVGKYLKKGDIVVYESTVYPGATEQDCRPILESVSGLTAGVEFKLGYSPERINPGDKEHTLATVPKIVSGQDQASLDIIAGVYSKAVTAGVYRAPSIMTAEAAKVIENTQRDVNIALINELAMIFDRMDLDTHEVLKAAGTKWNFIPFEPGLVGGHCIGVDPYYLTFQAERYGYKPEMILAGRRVNDNMGEYIAQQTIKKMILAGCQVNQARVGILGITFKENCPDIRNTKVMDIVRALQEYDVGCLIHDPWAEAKAVKNHYGIDLVSLQELKDLDALVIAVAHQQFHSITLADMCKKLKKSKIIMDVKNMVDPVQAKELNVNLWRL